MNNKEILLSDRIKLSEELLDMYNSKRIQTDKYEYRGQYWKIKNECIAIFIRENQLGSWYNGATGIIRWCNLSNIHIAKNIELLLKEFIMNYSECTDKKQLSKISYHFEQSLVVTLAKKYQVSKKKIYKSEVIQQKECLLVRDERNNKYYPFFIKRKLFCHIKIMW